MLFDGFGGLLLDWVVVIIVDLVQFILIGIDGYLQWFGIFDGLYVELVVVKQGWMCCIGSSWMYLFIGVIGLECCYIMVIELLQFVDDVIV